MSFNETKEEIKYYESLTPNAATKPSNPKDRAATTRLDLSLFPSTAIAYGALAFTEGDYKYGGYNWRSAGVDANIYIAAALRHISKWYNGENDDPDTGVPHLANAIACISVLIDSTVAGKLNDTRPPKADVAGLLADFEKRVKVLQERFPNRAKRYVNKDTMGGGQYVAVDSNDDRPVAVPEEIKIGTKVTTIGYKQTLPGLPFDMWWELFAHLPNNTFEWIAAGPRMRVK